MRSTGFTAGGWLRGFHAYPFVRSSWEGARSFPLVSLGGGGLCGQNEDGSSFGLADWARYGPLFMALQFNTQHGTQKGKSAGASRGGAIFDSWGLAVPYNLKPSHTVKVYGTKGKAEGILPSSAGTKLLSPPRKWWGQAMSSSKPQRRGTCLRACVAPPGLCNGRGRFSNRFRGGVRSVVPPDLGNATPGETGRKFSRQSKSLRISSTEDPKS